MSENADKCKVRFGQIFQKILVDSGKKLKDYFYFFPSGKHLDFKNQKSFNEVDLHINNELFNRHFLGNIKPFQPLNDQTVKRLDSTFVIVPGFGHHLIAQKAFGNQLRLLKKIGFLKKTIRNLVRWISKMPLNSLKEWNRLLEKACELSNDLIDLPEGITDLMRVTSESKYSEVRLDDSITLFSISAVYPESVFKDGLAFISNLDDVFLYVSGRELYNYNVFNDTQILLPDSKFFPGNGTIVDLGVVKTDHWGIALSRVFSRNYHDPFRRTEMIKSVLILLDEYFRQVKN